MKIPKNVTLSQATIEKADRLIKALDVDGISALISLLVREEFERRHGPTPLHETSSPGAITSPTAKPPKKPINYRKRPKRPPEKDGTTAEP